MENASKALIIAGAIILGILIIGLGMAVFNNAKEAITGTNMDAEKIGAINSKFEPYCGTKVKGSTVRSLCDVVRSNNVVADDTTIFKVTLEYKKGSGTSATATTAKEPTDITNLKNAISTVQVFEVTPTYDSNSGIITKITIQ